VTICICTHTHTYICNRRIEERRGEERRGEERRGVRGQDRHISNTLHTRHATSSSPLHSHTRTCTQTGRAKAVGACETLVTACLLCKRQVDKPLDTHTDVDSAMQLPSLIQMLPSLIHGVGYGAATMSSLLQIIRLFCKRASLKRIYSAKETYDLKEPTKCSRPIVSSKCYTFVAPCLMHHHRHDAPGGKARDQSCPATPWARGTHTFAYLCTHSVTFAHIRNFSLTPIRNLTHALYTS